MSTVVPRTHRCTNAQRAIASDAEQQPRSTPEQCVSNTTKGLLRRGKLNALRDPSAGIS